MAAFAVVVVALTVVAPATVVAAAFAVVAVELAVHAPAGIFTESPGWMTWLIPSVQPFAAMSASTVMQ